MVCVCLLLRVVSALAFGYFTCDLGVGVLVLCYLSFEVFICLVITLGFGLYLVVWWLVLV